MKIKAWKKSIIIIKVHIFFNSVQLTGFDSLLYKHDLFNFVSLIKRGKLWFLKKENVLSAYNSYYNGNKKISGKIFKLFYFSTKKISVLIQFLKTQIWMWPRLWSQVFPDPSGMWASLCPPSPITGPHDAPDTLKHIRMSISSPTAPPCSLRTTTAESHSVCSDGRRSHPLDKVKWKECENHGLTPWCIWGKKFNNSWDWNQLKSSSSITWTKISLMNFLSNP